MGYTSFKKQNLLIFFAFIISWIIGYWLFEDEYYMLWAFMVAFIAFYIPIAYLQFNRLRKNMDTEEIKRGLNIVLWLSIVSFIVVSPMVIDLVLFLSDINIETFYWISSSFSLFENIFYFVIVGLLFLAIYPEKISNSKNIIVKK